MSQKREEHLSLAPTPGWYGGTGGPTYGHAWLREISPSVPPGSAGQEGDARCVGLRQGPGGASVKLARTGANRSGSSGRSPVTCSGAREAPGTGGLFCWFDFKAVKIVE